MRRELLDPHQSAGQAPSKRLGWFIQQPDGNLGISVQAHELTDREWADFEQLAGVVNDLRAFVIDYYALVADYEALLAAEEEIASEASASVNATILDTPAMVRLQAKAQRSVSNFLAAGSAFRDRAVRRLSGRDTLAVPTADAFKRRVSEIYDAIPEYRITYVLRNHAQHFENPISLTPIEGIRGADGKLDMRMRMMLDPAVLVATPKMNAKVRAELSAMTGHMPIGPILKSAMTGFQRMMLFLLEENETRMAQMAQYAEMLFRTFEIPHDAKPVIFNGFDPAKGPPSTENCYLFGLDELITCVELLERLRGNVE